MVTEVQSAGPDPLLPVFHPGEIVTVMRTVATKSVVMVVNVQDPCVLGQGQITLSGRLLQYGVTPFADGKVANQADSINRLLAHLRVHCPGLTCNEGDAAVLSLGPPLLGLASTAQLLNELEARMQRERAADHAIVVGQIRSALTPKQLSYRTFGRT